jgi:Cu2+-exporting ATPase
MTVAIDLPCSHCTLPVPPGLIRDGEPLQFCCAGCHAVYDQIHACGLEDYYRFRDSGMITPQAASTDSPDIAAFDTPAYEELYVRRDGNCLRTDLVLEGITCAACVWLVERLPQKLNGLIDAQLSLTDSTLHLCWDSTKIKLSQIAATLLSFGYRPHAARSVQGADLYRKELRGRLIDLGVSGAIAGNLMLLAAALYSGALQGMDRPYEQMLRWLSLALGLVTLGWPGRTFFRGALTALRLRAVNLDLPIAIALTAGGIAGTINVLVGRGEIYFDSLAALIFLLLIGRLLQFTQQRRARGAVELLFSLMPTTCRIVRNDESTTILIQALRVDDIVEVRAGELFPADGIVLSGVSTVDTSLLTGELKPVSVDAGKAVFGGARNIERTLSVKVNAAGQDSRVGKLMQLIERGINEKPPIVRLADRVAAGFTYVVLAAAILTFICWWQIDSRRATELTVALLIVTCPCVIGLAVPLTFALTIGRLAQRGILVKSATALERLARGGRVVFDKTGTLTTGRMQVVEWHGDVCWQAIVGEFERNATHPVGKALHSAYQHLEAPADWRTLAEVSHGKSGGGIIAQLRDTRLLIGSPRMIQENSASCDSSLCDLARIHETAGRSVVLIAVSGRVVALAAVSDTLRADAKTTVQTLRRLGFEPEICSGDVQGAVDAVARTLQIDRARGGVLPEEKLQVVKQRPAIMIGDGANDAAALAAAEVGIAVAGGAEAALAAADVYIASDGLSNTVELIHTARKTLAIVRRNVVIAVSYNIVAGVLAMLGLMHPLMAACIMPLSSMTVISLTLLSTRRAVTRGNP